MPVAACVVVVSRVCSRVFVVCRRFSLDASLCIVLSRSVARWRVLRFIVVQYTALLVRGSMLEQRMGQTRLNQVGLDEV